MLNNLIIVGQQVFIVFLLVALGYIGGKTGLITDKATDGMANVVVSYAAPAMIIMAFQRDFHEDLIKTFLLTMVIALVCYAVCIILSRYLIRERDPSRNIVLRCGMIFSNCGLMSLPLQEALFGGIGVFYGAAVVAAFNLVFWIYGTVIMSSGKSKPSIGKVLLNPALLGTIVGITLFFTSTTLPLIPNAFCGYLSAMAMPISMLVIGQRLASARFKELFCDKGCLYSAALRLVAVPLAMTLVLKLIGFGGVAGVTSIISAASPAAASISMLAVTYGRAPEYSARMVSMQTLLSMLTMPVVIAAAYSVLL